MEFFGVRLTWLDCKYKSGICAVTLGFPAAEHLLIYTPNWNTVVIEKCQKEKKKIEKEK